MAFLRDSSGIKARLFLEVMGWPPEALTEHLKKLVDSFRKKFKILKEDYAEPEKVSEKMYVSHVEFEAEFPSFGALVQIALAYGPSAVEILEPGEIYLTASEMQDIVADISSKVQELDKQVKMLAAQSKKMATILQKAGVLKKEEKVEKVTLGEEKEGQSE